MFLLTLLVFIVILSTLVLIHELGHFLVAKKLGIKVEEFGFGFPPKLWGFKKGETEYTINWLPIGGFVKLYGEDEAGAGRVQIRNSKLETRNDKEDEKRAFFAKNPWQRSLVVVAGVIMNFTLAVVLSYVLLGYTNFHTYFSCLGDTYFVGGSVEKMCDTKILEVMPNTPAQNAGILPNSKVISVNGSLIVDSPNSFSEIVSNNKGKNMTILLEDEKTNKQYTVNVVPRVNPPKDQGALGIVLSGKNSVIVVSYNTPLQKVFSGFSNVINLIFAQWNGLGQLFSESIKTRNIAPLANNVSGPVGIGIMVNGILQIPDKQIVFITLFNLSIIMSTALGFFNILPIPALDGGRLFFIVIEAVTGKKVNQKFETTAHKIGLAILLGLVSLITFQDLHKLFSGFF